MSKISEEDRAAIQGRVLKYMLNQIARGALEEKVLREVTLHNLTNMIINDVENALKGDSK